jgi:hypothetical protein
VRGLLPSSQLSRLAQLRDDFLEWKESAGPAIRGR